MANWYCSSVDYAAVAAYQTAHVYAAGAIVRPTAPALNNERCYRTTAGGTSGGAEPTWNTGKGTTTTDSGGVAWVEVTGNQTYQAPGAWAAPHARLQNACQNSWMASGDTVFVAANHAETQSATISIMVSSYGAGLSFILCADNSGSGHVPPQSADLRTTATVTTTGNSSIGWSGTSSYCYGITFSSGNGSSSGYGVTLGTSGSGGAWQKFENCAFRLMANASSQVTMGGNNGAYVEWENTTVYFSAGASSGITASGANFTWLRTANAITGALNPNAIFGCGPNARILLEGVDLSGINPIHLVGSVSQGCGVAFVNCKLASGQSIYNGPMTYQSGDVDVISTDSAAAAYRQERSTSEGTLVYTTAVVRTGGASDGATAIAWQMTTSTAAQWLDPLSSFPLAEWNPVIGATVTLTILGIANMAALPNNDDIWIEARYLGNAGAPLGSIIAGTKANMLAANAVLTADTSAWDTKLTARANSHSYNLGDAIAVSTNPGRAFFCIVSAGSAASLPAGYATAVDGGTVVDGSATFRAGMRFKLVLMLSTPQPQMAGYIRAVIKAAKASTTFYVDPLITLS